MRRIKLWNGCVVGVSATAHGTHRYEIDIDDLSIYYYYYDSVFVCVFAPHSHISTATERIFPQFFQFPRFCSCFCVTPLFMLVAGIVPFQLDRTVYFPQHTRALVSHMDDSPHAIH